MNLTGGRCGHIRVDRLLGQGGMGDVYEGYDERLARRVALKILHPDAQLDDEARTRLIREARTLSKLDHPNICRIYDLIDDGTSEVLVLELIDGRTLDEVLKDGISTVEKLRIADDVASVLVAAHRAGIIHRDLKPENVMLTKSGQVKVLDFGLARWLQRKSPSGTSYRAISPAELGLRVPVATADSDVTAILDAPRRPDDDAANATAIGITVGTPLYMSPEQARGEPLTTASDMYSFGLMLQTMFSGQEPYPPNLTAREVMLKASLGESSPVTGVRRDVAALIKWLKSLAPSDRPTAADALRRIERIIDAPKRVARRAAAAAFLALLVFAGWKYTTDLRRERTVARQAEAEAKQRRAQADSLIEFMLGDLRAKLEPVGRLDVLDAVAERSLAYMSSLNTERLTPQEIARNSKALNQLGEVRMAQGNLPAALTVFERSLALAKAAAQRDPHDPELALGVGTAHFWVGNALQTKGDVAGALTHMREYRRIAEELAMRYPANDDYQIERAYGHSNVGSILEARGDIAGALEEYRLTLDVRNARLAAKPSDTKRRLDLAVGLNKVGYALERLGRLSEARYSYERELQILESLVGQQPKNTFWRERLGTSRLFVSAILEALGDDAGAMQHRDAALQLYRGLVAHDPTNANWQRNLAIILYRHAGLLRRKGSIAPALEELREAEGLLEQLVAKDSTRPNARSRSDLSYVETAYAAALLSSGNAASARAKGAAAIAILRPMPPGKAARQAFVEAQIALGNAEAAAGNRAAATKAWQAAYDALQPLPTSGEARPIAAAVAALIHLGRQREAEPLVAHLHQIGYREGDFERLLQRHP